MSNGQAASYGRAIELLRPTSAFRADGNPYALEIAVSHFAEACQILGGDLVIEAAKFYARHRTDKVIGRTVPEVVDELIKIKRKRGMSERYLGDLKARLKQFKEAYHVDISSVATGDVQRWLDNSRSTANGEELSDGSCNAV